MLPMNRLPDGDDAGGEGYLGSGAGIRLRGREGRNRAIVGDVAGEAAGPDQNSNRFCPGARGPVERAGAGHNEALIADIAFEDTDTEKVDPVGEGVGSGEVGGERRRHHRALVGDVAKEEGGMDVDTIGVGGCAAAAGDEAAGRDHTLAGVVDVRERHAGVDLDAGRVDVVLRRGGRQRQERAMSVTENCNGVTEYCNGKQSLNQADFNKRAPRMGFEPMRTRESTGSQVRSAYDN